MLILMTRRSDSVQINTVHGSCLQAQHQAHHPPICLQVKIQLLTHALIQDSRLSMTFWNQARFSWFIFFIWTWSHIILSDLQSLLFVERTHTPLAEWSPGGRWQRKIFSATKKLHLTSVKGVAKYGVDTLGEKRSPVAPDVLPNRGDPIIPNVEYHRLINGGNLDRGFAKFLFWTNLDS